MKKLSILILMVFLSGCVDADLQQSEQTKAQFHTYTTATPDAADKLLFSDEDSGHAVHTVLANDLPIGTATQTALDGKVNDTGNETIAGIKTFDSFPVSPSLEPTTDYQLANKKYIDDNANFGTEITLSADTTFDKDDGQSLIVNCTSDAELNPTGSFVEGFNVAVFNVGTNTILFDGAYTIQSGQYGMFAYDATNDEFVGGL